MSSWTTSTPPSSPCACPVTRTLSSDSRRNSSLEKKHSLLWNVIQEHLYLDVYEGFPRSKSQIDSTAGAMTGEANRQANKAKVYYGFLREPDVAPLPQEDDDEGEDGDKLKKKKKKENILAKKSKNDPNAPIATGMPFPEMKDSDFGEG